MGAAILEASCSVCPADGARCLTIWSNIAEYYFPSIDVPLLPCNILAEVSMVQCCMLIVSC